MNTSASHNDLEVEIRVMRLLDKLAAQEETPVVDASSVSASLDVSSATIRRVLSQFAVRGILIPKLVMECTKCGTENDSEGYEETQAEDFCNTCGSREIHGPAIVFEFSEALKRSAQQPINTPKTKGRRLKPQLLRPWTWFGARGHRQRIA